MNKVAKTCADDRYSTLCSGSCSFHSRIFCRGKNDFTYTSDHMYVSGGNSSSRKNLTVMKKEQIDDFTKLNVDFGGF